MAAQKTYTAARTNHRSENQETERRSFSKPTDTFNEAASCLNTTSTVQYFEKCIDFDIPAACFETLLRLTGCGGTMTAPGEIKPPMNGNEYFGDTICTWYINAPPDKNVVLGFDFFELEYSSR